MYSMKWAINNRCNTKCPYCMMEGTECGKELSLENKRECMDKMWDMGVRRLDFFGKEVLINDEVFKLLDYGKNFDMEYSMITNGINLPKYIKEIKGSPLSSLTFSYEGNVSRGNQSNTLVAVEELAKDLYIESTIDVHKKNVDDIVKYVDHLVNIGVSGICITPIIPIGANSDSTFLDFCLTEQEVEDLFFKLNEHMRTYYKRTDFTFTIPYQYARLSCELAYNSNAYTELKCTAGKDHFFLASDGMLYGCVSQYCANNHKPSCDFLETPLEDIEGIFRKVGGRKCRKF